MNGDEMRQLRERHGLSRSELAQILDVSAAYVSRLERGTKPVSDRVSARLSEWTDSAEPAETGTTSDTLDEDPEIAASAAAPIDTGAPAAEPATLKKIEAEAVEVLTFLLVGQQVRLGDQVIGVPGVGTTLVGLATGGCPLCVGSLAVGARAWALAFVHTYPNVARKLVEAGPTELIVASAQIGIPIALHAARGHDRKPPEPVDEHEHEPAPAA